MLSLDTLVAITERYTVVFVARRPPAIAMLLHAARTVSRVSCPLVQRLVEHNSHKGADAYYQNKDTLGWAIDIGRNDVVAVVGDHTRALF